MGSPAETNLTAVHTEDFLINKEFLECLLKKKIRSLKIEAGSNPGDNFLSIMHAVEVQTETDDKPQHIVIKCYPNHPSRREYLDETNVFGKEFFFYNEWAPNLIKLAKEAENSETEIHLAIPEFLGGNYVGSQLQSIKYPEPWSRENFIVMTDLRKAYGYKMANRMEGLDLEHASLALKELAILHALSWCYKIKNNMPSLTSTYPILIDSMYSEKFQEQFKPFMDSIISSTLKLVEDSVGSNSPIFLGTKKLFDSDTVELMQHFISSTGIDEDYAESFLRVKPPTSTLNNKDVKEPWLVGSHGDCWVNNMLFKYDPITNQPTKNILLDLQLYRESCPTTDLVYFFYSSTTLAVRKPNEETLLRVYYNQFLKTCDCLKCEPLPGYSFENLQRRFRRSKPYGFIVAIPVLSIVLKPAEESVNLDTMEGDMADMIANVTEGRHTNSLFKNRILEIANEFYEDGIL